MHVLQDCFLFDHLELPRIPWQPCYSSTQLDDRILWTVKNEPLRVEQGKIYGKIGITSEDVIAYVTEEQKKLQKQRILLCYPYYTAVQSGTIDMNYSRIVIEAVEGKIENLKKKHRVDLTMIFTEDDLQCFGKEDFISREDMLQLIDYSKQIRDCCRKEIEYGKSIQLNWSIVQETKVNMIPKEESRLVFTKLFVY